jgi:hypothetical protein
MSRLFGPARQNGVVVRDMDAALQYWTQSLGAGPFFRRNHLRNEHYRLDGKAMAVPDISVAIGNWGDLQIELICPHGDDESTWHRFLRNTGGGLHHVSVWSETYDLHVRQAIDLGLREESSGKVLGGPRYCYFGAGAPGQPLLEIADCTPEVAARFARIKAASVGWDGADPVR